MSCKGESLKLVAKKTYHSQELARKLIDKGFSQPEIFEAIRYLADLGYLNDEAYLESFGRKAVRSGWGPLEVKAKLYQKGIGGKVEYDEKEALITFARKKRGDLLKLKQSLYRKGFSIELINSSLRND